MLRPLAVSIVAVMNAGCAGVPSCALGEAMIETQLYFGMSKPSGAQVSERAWQAFVMAQIAPRFPEGFSVLDGAGFWRDAKTQETISEKSKVVVRMHAPGADSDAAIGAIVTAYKTEFQQDAVMRVDRPVCAQF
jgi:Protein of unknown function (DUF3574)